MKLNAHVFFLLILCLLKAQVMKHLSDGIMEKIAGGDEEDIEAAKKIYALRSKTMARSMTDVGITSCKKPKNARAASLSVCYAIEGLVHLHTGTDLSFWRMTHVKLFSSLGTNKSLFSCGG